MINFNLLPNSKKQFEGPPLYTDVINSTDSTPKEAIQISIAQFQDKIPDNRCNVRKIYQLLYGLAHTIKSKQTKMNQPVVYNVYNQLTIFDNYAFQRAVDVPVQFE
ncbi:Hypothetical_protein [Hexamita inflata]|uniref:Hypothetical_protein n=1 Tax=Hexamita inflata TaxID=28002 RepID=A0AA86VF22_9EUKA|nr:Hypothetical protein HINF_LOCUS52443 [Hexamita inflata]